MALTTVITAPPSTKTDKMIFLGSAALGIIYTVPAGRKFKGQAFVSPNNSSYITTNGVSTGIYGSSYGGQAFDIYLNAGESVRGAYAGVSGIESDA